MFNNLRELVLSMPTEQKCRDYFASYRWPDGKPYCVHCGSDKVYSIEKGKRYVCGEKLCLKKFSVTCGTVFHASNIPLSKWFMAVYLSINHKKGISSHQLARDLGVTQKTSWFMLHRLREFMRPKDNSKLDSLTEADETYIGGSLSNKHYKVRKRLNDNLESWRSNKTMALGMIERNGELKLKVINKHAPNQIQNTVRENLEFGATIVTDELIAYKALKDNYFHFSVNHSKNEYVRLQYHTNSIEGVFSHLKRMVYGIYHQISPKHTQRYLDEFQYRFNSRKVKDTDRFKMALTQMEGRLTYKQLVAAKKPDNYSKPEPTEKPNRKSVIKRQGDVVMAEYPSIGEAARANRLSPASITVALKNSKRKAGGFYWDFA